VTNGVNVFWANSAVGEANVMKADVCGGLNSNVSVLGTTSQIATARLAFDDTDVFWSNGGTISKCAIGGCVAPMVLATGQSTAANLDLTLSGANVFWGSSGIAEVGVGGGAVTHLLSSATVYAIVADGSNVFWVGIYGSVTGVWSCPIAGCPSPTSLVAIGTAAMPYSGEIGSMTQDSANVYWTEVEGNVLSCPKTGCATPTTLVSGLTASPNRITTDGVNVYWANVGKGTTKGSIMRCSVGGSGLKTLASGLFEPSGVAVDATSVYWSTWIDSNIWKLAK